MLTADELWRAARVVKRVGLGIACVAMCVAIANLTMPLPTALLFGIFCLAFATFLGLGRALEPSRLRKVLVFAVVFGGFGGMSLVVAATILSIGTGLDILGAAILPIGAAAAGGMAILAPDSQSPTAVGPRHLVVGAGLLGSSVALAVLFRDVHWLTVASWLLPVFVLATGGLISLARMLEKRP